MKKILYKFLILFGCIAFVLVFYNPIQSNFKIPAKLTPAIKTNIPTGPKKEVWLNIFVHGTYGTMLGMLSFNNLLKDNIRSTAYRGANKGMRNDSYFFQTQPILERGLQQITPTFDLNATEQKKLAAYPIIKAFDVILKQTSLSDSEQRYYTFGWTGLMSQHCRRFEAIRLFNALQNEIINLKQLNYDPKIRIMAHSHGGNLCLNLGAILPILNTKTFDPFYKYSLNHQVDDSIKKMLTIMKNLPAQEFALLQEGQKRWDYIPIEKNFSIDEFVLLGTPIQEETEGFLQSPVFKKIYSIYSEQDSIQQVDWISTKNAASKQRTNNSSTTGSILKKNIPQVVQIKVMYERSIIETADQEEHIIKIDGSEKDSFFDTLLGTKPSNKDPDHKELWCLAWDKMGQNKKNNTSFLVPLPTVVLLPLMMTMLATHPLLHDLDLNITPTKNAVGLFLTKHQDNLVIDSMLMDLSIIDAIKEKTTSWKPEDPSSQNDLNKMMQHLT